MRSVGALILAAGGSSRFGQPKQLINYQGETLVARAVRSATDADCAPIAVVVGGSGADVAAELQSGSAIIVQNNDWERGLGTSIRAGVLALLSSDPELDAIVLLACDQPLVVTTTISALIDEQHRSGKPMAAAQYAGTLGVPALFTRALFAELLALPDDSGAKPLLEAHLEDVATVAFEKGAIDIDTPADLERLLGDS